MASIQHFHWCLPRLTEPLKISELNSLVAWLSFCEGTWWVVVHIHTHTLTLWPLHLNTTHSAIVCLLQHVTMEDSYLCGYLKIKGLTEVKWSRTGSDTVYMQWVMMFSWVFKPFLGTYQGRGHCKPSAMQLTSPNWNVYWYNQPMWNWHALWQQARAIYWPICNTGMKAYLLCCKSFVWALYTVFGCLVLHGCVDWLPDCL